MKTCPICGARAFDDADVCYGCLHRFGEEVRRVGLHAAVQDLPAFLIRLSAERMTGGRVEWKCEVSPDKTPFAAA